MKGQTGVEYLLMIGGVLLTAIVIGAYLTTAASKIYNEVTGTSGATLYVNGVTNSLAYWKDPSTLDSATFLTVNSSTGTLTANGKIVANDVCTTAGKCLSTVSGGGGDTSAWKQNGAAIYYTGGNVGIGTANPGYPLDINGDVQVSETLHAKTVDTNNLCFDGNCARIIPITLLVPGHTIFKDTSHHSVNSNEWKQIAEYTVKESDMDPPAKHIRIKISVTADLSKFDSLFLRYQINDGPMNQVVGTGTHVTITKGDIYVNSGDTIKMYAKTYYNSTGTVNGISITQTGIQGKIIFQDS